jgi:hypothetical protein
MPDLVPLRFGTVDGVFVAGLAGTLLAVRIAIGVAA